MLQTLVRSSLIAIYLLIAVSLILYFGFWTGYRDTMLANESSEMIRNRLDARRHIDAATMRLLGGAGGMEKLSSFVHFQLAKPLGAIRVCALGDSNTYGSEVGANHDYPSYLQGMFKQHGFDNVQVLNFGKSWYGFAQTFVMWKNVASKFSCDFVLLLPMHFWPTRDSTFNHSDDMSPSYIHARLVLESEKLRLISPIGETVETRRSEYLRPIPHWRYLRYDRHPPNIFEAMLPSGRTLPNPFYYDRRPELEEFAEIYSQIIRTIAEDGPQVIVMFRGRTRAWYPRLIPERSPSIGVVMLKAIFRFPYFAPVGHASAWGQKVVATAFFRILTGDTESALSLANVRDKIDFPADTPEPLYAYKRVRVTDLGKRAGYFVARDDRALYRHEKQMAIFRRRNIGSVLALDSADGNIADACLLPLPNVPVDGAELIFIPENRDEARVRLGQVRQLQPDVAIFRANITKLPIGSCLSDTIENDQAGINTSGHLLLAGETIAKINRGVIQPNPVPTLSLRNSSDFDAKVDSLTTRRIIHIELQLDDGTTIRRPLLTIQPERVPEMMEVKISPAVLIERSFLPTSSGS